MEKRFFTKDNNFVLHDPDTTAQIILTREELKELARNILIELNVARFYLTDGRAGHLIDKEFRNKLKIKLGEEKCKELLQLID